MAHNLITKTDFWSSSYRSQHRDTYFITNKMNNKNIKTQLPKQRNVSTVVLKKKKKDFVCPTAEN